MIVHLTILFSFLIVSSMSFAKSYDTGRKGETIVTLDAGDFSTRNAKYEDGMLVLKQEADLVKFSSGVSDRRRGGVWHYLKNCDCDNNNEWKYCCPVLKPESRDYVLYGPYEDFSGRGELQVYLDIEIKANYNRDDFIAPLTRKYIKKRAENLEVKTKLLEFDIVGKNLDPVSANLGYDDFKCIKGEDKILPPKETNHVPGQLLIGEHLSPQVIQGVTTCIFEASLADRGSFLRTTGHNPKGVEFRLKASKDLVSIKFKKAELVWIANQHSEL